MTEAAVRRPVTTAVAAFIVLLLGGVALQRIPIDLMPDITLPVVTITTDYRNVSPVDIETLITEPIERAVARVSGVEEITSESTEGRSRVRAYFAWGTNLDEAVNDVRSRIDRLRDDLPLDSLPPVIAKYDVNASPIMLLGVSGNMNPIELRHFTEETLQYRLERIEGVAAANVRGGRVRQIHVNLQPDKIKALDLAPEEVVRSLVAENQNLPAGNVYQGNYRVVVRTLGEFQDLEEIQNALIARRNGRAIYVRDVATVEDSYEEIDHIIRINGHPGVMVSVIKRPGANTVQVADRVREEVQVINSDYKSQGILMGVLTDTSDYIKKSMGQVKNAAVYGAILVVVVLLVFLRSGRSTLIISTAIPISVVATFALIYFKGFTLNIMSFGGLALGIGMLVDNAIVVLENIFRHREAGAEQKTASLVGTREVGQAVTASTLTTIVVFLPVVFIPGTVGVMFQQLAWVVFFSLVVSLIVSLTVIPVLCAKYLHVNRERSRGYLGRLSAAIEGPLQWLDSTYESSLRWALRHRALVILAAAGVFTSSLYIYPLIGQEFMPRTDEGEVRVRADMEEGTRIEVMNSGFTRLEEIIRNNVPEGETLLTRFGNYSSGRNRPHRGDITIKLVPLGERARSTEQIAQDLRGELRGIAGMRARARPSGEAWALRRVGLTGDDRLEVNILGRDPEQAQQIARQVKDILEETPGITDARVSRDLGTPEAVLRVDRQKAADLGISVATIARVIRISLGGQRATLYREEGEEYEVLVRLPEADRQNMSSILDLDVKTPAGKNIPISILASLQERKGPVEIERLNQERVISIGGDTVGRDMESIVTDIKEKLKTLSLPPGYTIDFGGDYDEKVKAFRELKWGLILSLILVYMVMAAQFESFKDPLIILCSVPLAWVGIGGVLYLTDTTLNMNSYIGIVMLVGIVVNNAIILVDYMNLKIREGMSVHDAVVLGGRTRLRPILMTTLTTVLALIPMALGLGEGGEVQAPLARVVFGGLTSSTLITLILIPVVYATVKEWERAGIKEMAFARWRLANGRVYRK
jgi:HAE1 family hydrophobic/amphiphilic exporter-1